MAENQIRVVAFDAVGTLIYPQPSVAQVYFDIAQRHGSRLAKADIESRFNDAFRVFDRDNQANHFRTSETRERELWREVVAAVLPDVDSPGDCFEELFEWFASVDAWRLFDDVEATFQTLRDLGVEIAIASNFDYRLHGICDGFVELEPVRVRCVSSEVGHRKPSRGYYDALATMCECDPSAILMVGDTLLNDVEGAILAGMQAVLIDRDEESVFPQRIGSLRQVVQFLEQKKPTSSDVQTNRMNRP